MAFRNSNSVSNSSGGRPVRSVGKASLLLLLLALFSAAALLGGLQRGKEWGIDEGPKRGTRKSGVTEDAADGMTTRGGRNSNSHAGENSFKFGEEKTMVEDAKSELVGTGATDIEAEKGHRVTHLQLGKGHRVEVEEHDRDALEESGGRLSHPLDDDNSAANTSLGWRGTQCIAGGELTHKKLLSNCRKGRVEKRWCDRINRNLEASKRVRENKVPEGDASKGNAYLPLCGQYVAGRFSQGPEGPLRVEGSIEGVSQAALEATRQSLVDKIARTHIKAHQCNTPATFGGVVEKGTVYFERVDQEGPLIISGGGTSASTQNNGQPYVLKSRVCNAFSYLPNGAPIASVLHYHAAVAGRPHKRRGVLFTGDSMMRQIFLGLIGSIRDDRQQQQKHRAGTATEGVGSEDATADEAGMPMDHFFHTDALYVFRRDGDELIILDDARKQETQVRKLLSYWFPGYLREDQQANEDARGQETDVLFAMLYLWDITPSAHRPEPFKMHSLSLHIGAFMYWWNNKGQLSELEPYLANMSAHLDNNRQQTFIHVTTPWTRPETFGGIVDAVRTPRNRRAATWVDEERYLAEKKLREERLLLTDQTATAGGSRLGLRQRWVLDFSGIADANTVDGPISKTPDNIHYGCIWQPKYPQAITGMKDNGMGCKDPMNAAVGQWLLALLLRI